MRYSLRTLLIPRVTGPSSWLRFSLRTALIVVAIFCIWLSIESSHARKQKNAIETVRKLGGMLAYDFQMDRNGQWKRPFQPRGPQWLRKAIGDDYFQRVVVVNFDEGSDPTDDDLAVLHNLTDLRTLTLMNRRRITDDGLRFVAGLRRLQKLSLDGTNIDGSGLAHIRSLKGIELLTVSGTPLSDEGLEHIVTLSNLKMLDLSNTKITDKGLIHLASLKSLESLQIRDTAVTDNGLMHIKVLPSLKLVLLDKTKTTTSGRANLKQALPNCKVSD
jgi:hypothetical protein